jgi:hypothetical protein
MDMDWYFERDEGRHYYKLVGHEAVPCKSFNEWIEAFAGLGDNHIGYDKIGTMIVSTIFLGVNMALFGQTPQLFETKIFHGPEDYEIRCETWEQAERQHAAAIVLACDWLARAKPDENVGFT